MSQSISEQFVCIITGKDDKSITLALAGIVELRIPIYDKINLIRIGSIAKIKIEIPHD